MRPLRLELTAFGPFAGTQDVDFTVLAEAGLFHVSGPTGAGKTSLLDAVSYALYGRAPGTRRPEGLRSHHAPDDRVTEVALEYSLGGADWRVTRRPPHDRAKARGAGTTRQKPTATLARRTATGTWESVCSGVEEVSREVRARLGLDAEQFAQVVLLPQGQVQRALVADARDREQLLSSLFDTGRFGALTAALADRARLLEGGVHRAGERLASLRVEAGLAWREVAKELEDGDDPTDPPAAQEALDQLVVRAGAARATVEADAARARAQAEAAAARWRDGERVADRWRRRRVAMADRARLAAEAPAVDGLRRRLADADAAAPCGPLLDAALAARRQAAARSAAVTAATAPLAGLATVAAEVHKVAEAEAEAPDHGRGTGRRDAASVAAVIGEVQEVGGWAAAPPGAAALDRVRGRLAEVRGRLSGLAERLAGACALALRAEEGALEAARHEAAAVRADQEAARWDAETAAHQRSLTAARTACRRLGDERAEASRLARAAMAAAELLVLADAWHAARDAAAAAVEAAQDARDAHLTLYERRVRGMAGELAARLGQGDACPVCGAHEHPEPAHDGDAVHPEELAAAADHAEALRVAADQAVEQRESAAAALEVARDAVGDGPGDPVEAAAAADAAQAQALRTARLAQDEERLAAALEAARAAAAAARDDAGTARRAAAAAAARATAERHQAEAERSAVVAVVGDGDPARLLAGVAALAEAVERVAAAVAHRDRAREEADVAARAATAVVERQGFADADAAAAALLDPAEVADLRRRVQDHDHARAAAEAALADPDLAGLDSSVPEPDVTALGAAAEHADRAAEAAVARRTTVARAAAALDRLAAAHGEAAADLAPRAAERDRVRHLADLCSGSGNARRMSLERYVLAAVLEEVTARASVRLAAMTDGRYALRHSDERARGGAASGLAIRVRDAFTGVEREVGSLSGGETFQASLALALGLADTVQATSGGVPIDTLFVDEGFGSLDPEALEQAMAELDRLREGGRLVGVVSHVAALAERIPAGLHVTRGRSGSTVRVRVAAG